jgi:BirA family biotin operon repressor/biotin-[acetyl-CoA-carboxylase] ligase
LIPLAVGIGVGRLFDLVLKWPNDLLVDERKVGGILVEASGSTVTIGVGLNLWWPGAPADRTALSTEDPGPAAYVSVGSAVGEAISNELERGPDGWGYDEYLERCMTVGHEITWGDAETGFAKSIDPSSGALVLSDGRKLTAGDVRHVRAF